MTEDSDQASQETALKPLRDRIDEIDRSIQKLINERARCALKVADVKRQALVAPEGSTATKPTSLTPTSLKFYRPEREAQVLRAVMDRNEGPLDDENMARLFREIMSSCLALEEPMRVAYLGPEGTFTHAAALKHFGHSVVAETRATIDEVFRDVAAGTAHYGVVPVENSTEGMVNHTLDCFIDYRVHICGEVESRIHHHLLVAESTKPEKISRIYSHEQSLAQCRKWLDAHYPNIERVAVSSNAEAARRIASEWHSAAIASDMAEEIYGLKKLANNIEDNPQNTTRFLIVGQEQVPRSGTDKTSIIVSVKNKPGALFELLKPFHENGISLTRVETRPSSTDTWSYVFFIDFEGHQDDEIVKSVLSSLETESASVQRLGSYPVGIL